MTNNQQPTTDHVIITKTKTGFGYFLTIREPEIDLIGNTWTVTEEELKELRDKLNAMLFPL